MMWKQGGKVALLLQIMSEGAKHEKMESSLGRLKTVSSGSRTVHSGECG
jgi:hypothetical protein